MGKKMAGTNEFAFFRCKRICTGGGPESGRKKFEKCLPAGTGTRIYREQKRHIKLFHIKLCPVTPVTGPPGRVSGQKDLCSLGSEDST